MFKIVGLAIPAAVARAFTAERKEVVFGAIARACEVVQAKYSHLDIVERKAKAHQLTLDDHRVVANVIGIHPELDTYLEQAFVPAGVDGVLNTFNQSLWFSTSKPVTVGGVNNPVPATGVSQIPGAPPSTLPDGQILS